MACFTLLVEGPTISSPVERQASSAADAEYQMHLLHRTYGRFSTVKIWEEGRRAISVDRLATMVRMEREMLQGSVGSVVPPQTFAATEG